MSKKVREICANCRWFEQRGQKTRNGVDIHHGKCAMMTASINPSTYQPDKGGVRITPPYNISKKLLPDTTISFIPDYTDITNQIMIYVSGSFGCKKFEKSWK